MLNQAIRNAGRPRATAAPWVIAVILALPSTAAAMDLEREVNFNIPAQNLGSALLQFSQQTRIQVVVSGDIRGESSEGVRGRRAIKEALDELLRPAGLRYHIASDDSISVAKAATPESQTSRRTADSSPIRLAQTGSMRAQDGAGVARARSESGALSPDGENDADARDMADVTVTGSRLVKKHLVDAAPVTVLSADDIASTGATSVGELLRELPAAVASTSESAGRGNNGSATVALRGLGAVNTLVLINGRRVLANNANGLVDLNSIPFDAVERVEVLQDGASAVYGSDAIAGVVNIIMTSRYDGLQLKGGYGVSSRDDLPHRELSLTFGREYDSGSFVFNANWSDSDGNVIADRPVSLDPDWRNLGGRNFRDPLPLYPVVTGLDPMNPARRLILRDGIAQPDSLEDFRDFVFPGTTTPLTSGNDGINYWEYESSAVDIEKTNLWFSGAYELNGEVSLFAEGSFNNRQSFGFFAPDYVGAVYGAPVTVSANNDFNPFGVNLDVARTLVEQLDYADLRARMKDVDANTFRVVAGLKGSLGRWKWDASFNHQQLHEYSYGGRNKVMQFIRQAAGDSDACRTASNRCVPINLLGGPGSITREMLDFVTVDTFTDINTQLRSIVANVAGTVFSLPAGDVGLATGVEYRAESFDQTASDLNAFIEQGTDADAHPPEREVKEIYLEAAVPLLTEEAWIGGLDLDLAVRLSDYNDFGSTTNPKVGLRWQVLDSVLVRGSWGTGFRAPTFTEAYGSQTRGFQPVQDPCLGQNFLNYPACNGQQATTTAPGAFVVRGGNPALQPEEADNLTVGLVWRPRFLGGGLAMTLDYFQIEKADVIGTANVNYVIEQNALFGTFADRVTRDAGNAVSQVVITLDNLLGQEIRGYDFGIEYQTETARIGEFDARLDLTYLDSHRRPSAPGQPAVERVGTYSTETGTLAKYRASARLGWSLRNFGVSTSLRYVDDVINTGSLQVAGRFLQADDYLQNDINFRYDLERLGTSVTLGIENVFDEMPPWLEGNFSNGFDERTFHSRGRFYYGRVVVRF
jgi:iron complex outermembrane receptor protein